MARPEQAFFSKPGAHTLAKSGIVAEYFRIWASKLVGGRRKRLPGMVVYLDLFCGPGEFEDETPSTPVLVLRTILRSEPIRHRQRQMVRDRLLERLWCIFNDSDARCVAELQDAVRRLPGYERLAHKPRFSTEPVGPGSLAKWRECIGDHPTFLFLDPFGFKDLDLEGINGFITPFGSECVFFLNYHDLKRALGNDVMRSRVAGVFGDEAASALREELEQQRDAEEGERIVLGRVAKLLKGEGGERHVLAFALVTAEGRRYHLIHVTKNWDGHDEMRLVMAKHSTPAWDRKNPRDVPSFQYSARPEDAQPPLFWQGRTIDDLAEQIASFGKKGNRKGFLELYKEHSPGLLFMKCNYKAAIAELVRQGRVRVEKDGAEYSAGKLNTGKLPEECEIVWL